MGARTIDGDNDDYNNNNNVVDNEDCDAGERETIGFFDQSVFFFHVLLCWFVSPSPLPAPKEKVVANFGFEFSLLREEGQTDVFLSRRRWYPSSEEEESDEDEEEDLEDDDDEDSNQLYLT